MNDGPHVIPTEGEVTLRHVVERDGRRIVHVTKYVSGWGPFFVSTTDRPIVGTVDRVKRAVGLVLGVIAWGLGAFAMSRTADVSFAWARANGGGVRYAPAFLAPLFAFFLVALIPSALLILFTLRRSSPTSDRQSTPPRAP